MRQSLKELKCRTWWSVCLLWLVLAVPTMRYADAQEEPTLSEEEKREKLTAQRFLQVLVRRPNTGTSLDRVFGYHIGKGNLGELIESLSQTATSSEDEDESGRHWMVVGLLQLQRGEDAAAITALGQAEKRLAENPLAAYYHGQALLLVGRNNDAAAAMQRALDRKPPRQEFLRIAGQLGRLYQRDGRTEDAVAIWEKLEESFPGDDGVRQRIARVMMEEGDTAGALERFDSLAKSAKTPNDQIVFALRAAELRIRTGAKQEAITALESLLKKLRPGSYLHDEARRRIETAFLENGDYAGLAEYYDQWLQKNPEDVNAMVRLARTLSVQGRGPEAITWFEKAISLAPSESEPRVALINAYVAQQKYAEAAGQYQALVDLQPGNPDHLVRWGQLLLEDQSVAKEKRKEAAAKVWMRLAESRSDDAVIQSQVADLLRGSDLQDQAIERYRVAITLSPQAPQYKEYLGEYLHELDRKDEAFEVWRSLAEGDLRTRANLVRLAEVLHQFERAEEGLATMAEACEMDPTIEERLRYAKWLRDAEEFDDSLKQIQLAAEVTESLDERERVFAAEVETYQTSGRLDERIEVAKTKIQSNDSDDELWRRLAILYKAKGQTREAMESIEKALVAAPKSIEALVVAAQMYEDTGRLQPAIEKRAQLAESDQRFKAGHLQKLSSLYLRIGKTDEAIAVGKQLLAASNGTVDAYRFYANLCGQIGRTDERLDTLRRCARANPRNDEAQRLLATQLAEDFKTEQAIELYWKMFDGAREIDDRRRVVTQLADLYLRTNRLDQLIARLEIRGREAGDRRSTIDLVSTAHEQVGDLGLARQALESLLREGGRDTMLIERLVSLAEQTGEYEEAVRLQRQLSRLAPDRKNEARLAGLLLEVGELEEAQAMWMRLAEKDSDPGQVKRNINRLFAAGETKTAITLAQRVLERAPTDWQILHQLMVLQATDEQWEAAAKSADQLVTLDVKDTEKPTATTSTVRNMNPSQPGTQPNKYAIRFSRIQNMYEFYQLVDQRYGYSSSSRLPTPMDFGHAKTMALYCQLKRVLLQDGGDLQEFVAEAEKAAMADDATPDDAWRWYEVEAMAGSVGQTSQGSDYRNPKTWNSLRRMAQLDEKMAATPLTQMLSYRQNYAQRDDIDVQPMDEEWFTWLKSKTANASDKSESDEERLVWSQFYAAELRIRGEKEQADQYLKEGIATALEDGANVAALAGAIQQATLYYTDDELWPLVERALKQSDAAKQNYAFRPVYLLSQFTQEKRVTDGLSPGPTDAEYRKRVIRLTDLVMKAEAQSSATRRAVQLTGVGGSRNTYQMVGNSYQQVNIEFPPKGLGPNDQVVQAQQNAWNRLRDHSQEWIDHLNNQIASGEESRQTIWRQMFLATIYQWEGRTEDAIDTLAEAAQRARADFPPMEPELRLMSADLLLRQDRKREALEAIDSLSVYDQRTMALREFAAARLAAQIGDVERATLAARRLFGVRLNTSAQIELAKLMRKLEMHQLASDLVRRMQTRGGRTTQQMQSLMTYFSAQGEKEQAAEVAMALLRRSAPKRRRSSSSNYQTADDVRRRNALQALASAGRLTSLIKATEERLKNAPKSQKIRSELSEMYLAAGQTAKSAELLGGTELKDVNGTRALEATAEQFVKAGKMDAACEAYLKFLRRKQSTFSQKFYEIKRPFEERKRLGDLADLMLEVGLRKFTDHRVAEVCESLIRQDQNVEKARELYEGMLELPSTTTNSMYSMSNIMGSARTLLTDAKVVKKTAQYLIKASEKGTPWQTLFTGYSTSSDGRKNNVTTYFVRHVAQDEANIKMVEEMLREKLAEKEDWIEGKTWLALMLTERKEYDEAIELLEPLLSEESLPRPTYECVWLVGSLIDSHKPMQPLATKLYDYALTNTTSRNSGSEFKYTLEGRVSQFMADLGNKERARQMVLEAIEKGTPQNSSRADYNAYRQIRTTLSLVDFLAEIDYPADAFKLVREFDRSLFVTAGRYNRGYDEQFARKETELLKAVQKLGGLATARSMIVFSTKKPNAIDLGFNFPERPFTGAGISSLWVELVEKARGEEEGDAVSKLIAELADQMQARPHDDSVAFAHAITSNVADDAEPLRMLVKRWKEEDSEGAEVANPKLRGQAFVLALLTLHRSTNGDDAEQNAELVRSVDVMNSESIGTLEKSYFFAGLGKRVQDEAEKKKAWAKAIETKANRWILFDLSQAAAQSGLKELSTKAFQVAVEAPKNRIVEATQQPSASSLGQLLSGAQASSSVASSSNQQEDLDPEAVRLAKWVFELDAAWRKAKIYTQPVYEPLIALTLGAGGQSRALCTPVEMKNNRMQIDSVFDRLAKRAHWSKRTDDLVSRLEKDDVASQLMCGIALLRGERGEEAAERYKAIDPLVLRSVPKELALQSILLALGDSHCRVPATKLGLALVDQNRPSGRYENVEPFDRFSLELAKVGMANDMDQALVGKAITDYLELSAHENDRYSGDYRFTRRLPQLEEVAKPLLQKGRTVEAMNYLAMRQEVFDQGFDRNNDWVGSWALESFRGMKDPQSAYQKLADVTFQGDGALAGVRVFVRRQPLPEWIPPSVGGDYPPFPEVKDPSLPIATSFSLLAQLAAETGQKDDLLKRLESARSRDRAGSITASAIVHALLEEPIEKDWIDEIEDYIDSIQPSDGKTKSAAPLAELQLASLLAGREEYQSFASKVVGATLAHGNRVSRSYLNPWVAGYQHKMGWAETSELRNADGLKHWERATLSSAKDFHEGKIKPVWVADGQGVVRHICGFGQDSLWLKYPLKGNFTVEWENADGDWNEADMVFSDLRITPIGTGNFLYLKSQSSTRNGRLYSKSLKKDWNHCKYELDDEWLSFYVNGTLVYREKRSDDAPWFAVHAEGFKSTNTRGIKIEGAPEVPKQLDLIPSDGLRGWSGQYLGNPLPAISYSQEHREKEAIKPRFYGSNLKRNANDKLSWTVNAENELVSGGADNGFQKQSCIRYQRPLCDGDVLSYEFFYEEGKTVVHPTIGRIAYVLRPNGLHLHWMNAANTSWKIPQGYEIPLPTETEPQALPLNSGQWNTVEVTRRGDQVAIKLNQETIFEQKPQSRLGDMVFGLFHYRDQSDARVRNIQLQGDWPDQLPANLFEFE
ncbi:MAG: DUF1583 domain-containing protein [Planctomycetota bacterium]